MKSIAAILVTAVVADSELGANEARWAGPQILDDTTGGVIATSKGSSEWIASTVGGVDRIHLYDSMTFTLENSEFKLNDKARTWVCTAS